MKLMSSSTARPRTANAALRSFGGSQIPSPVRRIAPKPRRCTEISPPSETSPARLAESSFLFMIDLQNSPVLRSLLRYCSLLAKPLRVSYRAVELVSRLIEFELSCFRSLCSSCEKRSNLGRIHRLKTASKLSKLLAVFNLGRIHRL